MKDEYTHGRGSRVVRRGLYRGLCVVENVGRHTVYIYGYSSYNVRCGEACTDHLALLTPPPPPILVRAPSHVFTSLRIFFTIGALSLTLALITGGGDGQRTSIVFSLGMNAAVVCCLCTLLLAGLVLVSAGYVPTPALQCVLCMLGKKTQEGKTPYPTLDTLIAGKKGASTDTYVRPPSPPLSHPHTYHSQARAAWTSWRKSKATHARREQANKGKRRAGNGKGEEGGEAAGWRGAMRDASSAVEMQAAMRRLLNDIKKGTISVAKKDIIEVATRWKLDASHVPATAFWTTSVARGYRELLNAFGNRTNVSKEAKEAKDDVGASLTEEVECPVCLERVSTKKALVASPCGHTICCACYKAMPLRTKRQCVTCRAPVRRVIVIEE